MKKERKIFTENLIKDNRGRVDWKSNIGKTINFIYGEIYGEIEILNMNKRYVDILCKYNGNQYTGRIKNDNLLYCKIGNIIKTNTRDFKFLINHEILDSCRNLIITDREYRIVNRKDGKSENQKWYKYTCNKCGWTEGWIVENSLLVGSGCACCCPNPQVVVPEINSIWAKARWMCDLGVSEEDAKAHTPQSSKKIKVKCPDCGTENHRHIDSIYNQKSIACQCSDKRSYPSKYVHELLNQININFKSEIKFKWCNYFNKYKNKETYGIYDFVINDIKLIIEVDGGFHRKDNEMNGQTKEESQYIDRIKDRLAEENGYEVIRISDEGDIRENILNSKLNELFDLSNIDWLKCEEFALSNLVKEVCKYWNQKKELETTSILAKMFNLSNTTIIKYLKNGTNLGWTYYNSADERTKSSFASIKNRCKQIEVFKDGEYIGTFNSARELDKISEVLLGVKLSYKGISEVCTGRIKTHKGYSFKYKNKKNNNKK